MDQLKFIKENISISKW